jgi:aspartyl-tRNA(Asn)/glutamyl-tRNA(Gln) amidotransferase subunit A
MPTIDERERWLGLASDPKRARSWLARVRELEEKLGAFLQLDPQLGGSPAEAGAKQGGSGCLAGIPFAVKDNIAVRDFRLTCGSRLLRNFVSPYTATAVQRLQAEGAMVAGKTNLDEFGMGSSTEGSALAKTANPWDLSRVPGGSSGGSAAAVASGMVAFALGSDTGGSVRQPAAFCGVYGLKPTYGAVSRYGLVAYASSLEVIGIIARDLALLEEVFSVMRGQDPLDHSSLPYAPPEEPAGGPGAGGKPLRLGVPDLGSASLHPEVESVFASTLKSVQRLGFSVQPIELPTLQYVVSAYYVIACAEASANLARFDGIRYGERVEDLSANPEELVRLSRSRGLGPEVKLRILLGTYVLRSGFQDQYYRRAQQIRTAIRRDFDRAFQGVDLVLMPVYPCPPFKPGTEAGGLDGFQQKLSDVFTCSANLAGIPALSFPAGLESGLPIGMQFLAPAFGEKRLLRACARFAEEFPVPPCPLTIGSLGG